MKLKTANCLSFYCDAVYICSVLGGITVHKHQFNFIFPNIVA